ncbi:hypothetical protein HDE_13183 [Halotydeus destructor]|nr:hypothetical protein HDE_13183 [Halotydeus destructor]
MIPIFLYTVLIISLEITINEGLTCFRGPDDLVLKKDVIELFVEDEVYDVKLEKDISKLPRITGRVNLRHVKLEAGEGVGGALMYNNDLYLFVNRTRPTRVEVCKSSPASTEASCKFDDSMIFSLISLEDNFVQVSAATEFPGGFLISYIDSSDKAYQVILDKQGRPKYDIRIGKTSTNNTPSAILFRKETIAAARAEFIVFFQEIFGIHQVTVQPFLEGISIRRDVDYQLSRTWLGCKPEFCFDSRVDFAYTNNTNFYLGRGYYEWTVPLGRLVPTIEPTTTGNEGDAAILVDDVKMIFKDDYILETSGAGKNQRKIRMSDIFIKRNLRVDAALRSPGGLTTVMLISGRTYITYNGTGLHYYPMYRRYLNQLSDKLPAQIDAAVLSPTGSIYIFSNNFFYILSLSAGARRVAVHLMQNQLFDCPDSFYQSSVASAMLNITRFRQFDAYRKQFVPTTLAESSFSTERPRTRTPRNQANSTQKPRPRTTIPIRSGKQADTGMFLFSTLMFILSLVLISSTLVLLVKESKSKPEKHGDNETFMPLNSNSDSKSISYRFKNAK